MSTMTLEQVRDWHLHQLTLLKEQWQPYQHHKACADAIDAHLRREVKVPDGWQLVPIEPTEEMLEQATTHDISGRTKEVDQWNRDTWSFMLAAAPTSVATDGQGGEG